MFISVKIPRWFMLNWDLFDMGSFHLRLAITEMLKEPFCFTCNIRGHKIDEEKHREILDHIDYSSLNDGFKYKLSHDNCYRCSAYLDIIVYPDWPKKLFINKH